MQGSGDISEAAAVITQPELAPASDPRSELETVDSPNITQGFSATASNPVVSSDVQSDSKARSQGLSLQIDSTMYTDGPVVTMAVPHVWNNVVKDDTVPFPVHRTYEIPLSELENATFDTSPVSTPCTFRLLDCRRFSKQRTLVIYETLDVPTVGYITVSYPWLGVTCNERVPPEGKTFQVVQGPGSVAGGDPISISILRRICFLAMVDGIDFLWLDRLCIRQGDPIDSKWQIDRMYTVFKSCQMCIVVPGGLQRLVNVYEETPWITRAWTLEVLAAPEAQIMTTFAPTSLEQFLLGATDPLYGMRLFGRHRANHRSLLIDALYLRTQDTSDKQKYRRNLAIWKCALARTASKTEDLIPSVIGLFDAPEAKSSVEKATVLFLGEVRNPDSSDICVLAFRDAVLLSGQNVSPQWEKLIGEIAPTSHEDPRLKMRISQPILISTGLVHDFPISKTYEISLSELVNTRHDISSVSSPCTFRLLDCKKYLEAQTLVIYETPNIPKSSYAAVSYPWVGTPSHYFTPTKGETFEIIQDAGRLGDAISTEVVRLACNLAIQEGADYMWVDRLCIRQMDRQDKAWQISRMCDVYRLCRVCITFPGGLQRLAGLDEETPWATRMWTLQEALVPSKGLVLYSLTDTSCPPDEHPAPPTHAKLLASTTSVYYSPLEELLPASMAARDNGMRLFGHAAHGYGLLLRDALSLRGQNVTSEQRYQRYLAIWRSAVTRSSDRPQDLLLSTMGLFDISLAEGEQRSSETIIAAFVKEFQKQGIADVRVVAFRDAVRRGGASITGQWRRLIEEFDRSLPLLPNGLAPTPNHDLPLDKVGLPVVRDGLGQDVFLGSALTTLGAEHALHPCKVVIRGPSSFACLVPYGGLEKEHDGRWELKPFDLERMEWVATSHGKIPHGREPIEGGYEKDVQYRRQRSLYYALATVANDQGMQEKAPGKTGHHLGGCCVGLGGKEHFIQEDYMILCWKEGTLGAEKTWISPEADDQMFWSRPNLPLVSFPGIRADR